MRVLGRSRIFTYLGLLYQDPIKQGVIAKGTKLPPVLPILLYNGKTALAGRNADYTAHKACTGS
jgi:hypothetical protein